MPQSVRSVVTAKCESRAVAANKGASAVASGCSGTKMQWHQDAAALECTNSAGACPNLASLPHPKSAFQPILCKYGISVLLPRPLKLAHLAHLIVPTFCWVSVSLACLPSPAQTCPLNCSHLTYVAAPSHPRPPAHKLCTTATCMSCHETTCSSKRLACPPLCLARFSPAHPF